MKYELAAMARLSITPTSSQSYPDDLCLLTPGIPFPPNWCLLLRSRPQTQTRMGR
jgi:hypothetical protein